MFKQSIKKLLIVLLLTSFVYSCKQKTTHEEPTKQPEKKIDQLALLSNEIAANPKNAVLYFSRAKIFMDQKNLKQAFDDISKAVSLDSANAEYYMLLADVSFKGLQIQNSIDAFKKANMLDPKNKEGHLKLSELYLYIKAYPLCLSEANEALKIDKNLAKAYFLKGFAYKETADTAKAISSFQTVIEIEPGYYDAHIQLGNIEAARKNKIALQYYNNALRLQPGSTEALYDRGLLLQNMGEIDKAIEDYTAILKLDGGYADAHYNLGYIDLAYKKDYKSAIIHFTNAIQVNDKYAEAFYNRGLCYEFMGDKKSAEKDFRQALDIVPTFKLAKKKLGR
jgi:tetratricopeptide (TPR) repeat protein